MCAWCQQPTPRWWVQRVGHVRARPVLLLLLRRCRGWHGRWARLLWVEWLLVGVLLQLRLLQLCHLHGLQLRCLHLHLLLLLLQRHNRLLHLFQHLACQLLLGRRVVAAQRKVSPT